MTDGMSEAERDRDGVRASLADSLETVQLHEMAVRRAQLELRVHELDQARSDLEQSRARYAELYDSLPVASFVFDTQGIIRDLNQAAAALLGQDRDVLLGSPFVRHVRMPSDAPFWRHLNQCRTSTDRTVGELVLGSGASRRWVQLDSAPVLDRRTPGAAGVVAVRTAMTDVTRLKAAEWALDQRTKSEHRLRNRLDVISILQSRVVELLSGADLATALEIIVEHARSLTCAEIAALGILREPSRHFDHWISRGNGGRPVCDPPHALGTLAAIAQGEVVRVVDTATEGALDLPPGHPPVTSFIGIPVRYQDRTLGVLYAANRRGGEFSGEDVSTLVMLAARVGPAIDIARLREREARERARLELLASVGRRLSESLDRRQVLEALAHGTIPHFADCCVVYAIEGERCRPLAWAHADPEMRDLFDRLNRAAGTSDDAIAGERALTGALAVHDVAYVDDRASELIQQLITDEAMRADVVKLGLRSLLVVAIEHAGRTFGALAVGYCASGRRYEEADIVTARAVASRAALALESSELYDQARHAASLRDDLLAIVSHDLRSPLTAVIGNAELLGSEALSDKGRRRLKALSRAAVRMKRLIADLLDAAAIEAGMFGLGRLCDCEVAPLFEEAVGALPSPGTGRTPTVLLAASDDLPPLRCDRERILQVLGNLLGNAAKFTPADGIVRLSARLTGGWVELSVADSGPGIDDETQAHLFDRYYKGAGGGTGLGLYIARGIVEQHGGSIRVESRLGAGATFLFTVPAAVPPPGRAGEAA